MGLQCVRITPNERDLAGLLKPKYRDRQLEWFCSVCTKRIGSNLFKDINHTHRNETTPISFNKY